MVNIKYSIEFFSDWHCGSGLAAGADVDTLVVKDNDRLPFVPGKTMKGLVREAAETIMALRNEGKDELIKCAFGFFNDKDDTQQGCMFFTNAELPEDERMHIVEKKLQEHLCRAVSSTAIGCDGIAKDKSLRRMEVVVPCTLYGEILDVPEELMQAMKESLKFIKRLGVNRNRGLGRCEIKVMED